MTTTANGALNFLFTGKKEKWIPLFRRLLARCARVSGIELVPYRSAIAVTVGSPKIGLIQITPRGLRIGLALSAARLKSPRLRPATKSSPKFISHHVLISEASEIDDEFLQWVKAAATAKGRTAKRRST